MSRAHKDRKTMARMGRRTLGADVPKKAPVTAGATPGEKACPCHELDALMESERKYRLLAENAIEVIWTMTLDGHFTYLSPSVERLSGYTVDEAMALPMESKMTPASLTYFMDTLAKYIALPPDQRPLSKTMRFEMVRKDGTTVWTEATVRMLTDRRGTLVGLQGSTRDISEQIRSGEALKESENRMQTILRSLPDIVVGMDTKGHVTFYHAPDPRMLLMPPERFMGKNVFDVMSENLRGIFLKAVEANRRNEVFDAEFYYDKDGVRRCYLAKVSPIFTENEYTGSVAVIRDITERKMTERNMKHGLLKFDLSVGSIYLVKESSPNLAAEAFRELQRVGYKGMWFSREAPPKGYEQDDTSLRRYWLTERGTKCAMAPDPVKIEGAVLDCPADCAVLIEGLEYITQQCGFEAILAFIQHLRDIAVDHGHMIIVSLDPSFMSARQVKFLEKEAKELSHKAKLRIDDDLAQILKYAYEQNLSGQKPNYNDVSVDLRVSKPTTRKRIARLVRLGLLVESLRGKSKVLETTEKGRSHFSR